MISSISESLNEEVCEGNMIELIKLLGDFTHFFAVKLPTLCEHTSDPISFYTCTNSFSLSSRKLPE